MTSLFARLFRYVRSHEWVRFVLVGGCAATIHYGVYLTFWLLNLSYNVSYTLGWAVSFTFNFFASNLFTFRTKPTLNRLLSFSLSHGTIYLVDLSLLNLLVHAGVPEPFAPPAVIVCGVPVHFVLVRLALRSRFATILNDWRGRTGQ